MELETGLKEYTGIISGYAISFQCKYNPASGEVILFLHGLACSSDSFNHVFDTDYFPGKSLILIDLPGFGKSSKPETFSYRMEDQASIIEQLLSVLPFNKIHIAAHSMGGAVALLFSPGFYSRVMTFANIEGNLVGEDCGFLSRGVIKDSLDGYKKHLYEKQLLEFKDHPQLHFDLSSPLAVYKSAQSLVKWSDSGELLRKFKNLVCKKSYFYGEVNKDLHVIHKLDFAGKYMISNSGHGMTTENPEEFFTKLADFIG